MSYRYKSEHIYDLQVRYICREASQREKSSSECAHQRTAKILTTQFLVPKKLSYTL